jgi:hypothetical protein
VREAPLLLDRHLRVHPRPRRRLIEAVALDQPLDLLAGTAVDHHQAVESQVDAGLHQEGGVGHDHPALTVPKRRDPPGLLLADARVDDGVEPGARGRVREHPLPEAAAVHGAVCGQHRGTEGLHHVVMGRGAGAMTSCATRSRSRVEKPAADSRRRTRDLPLAIPPVSPTRRVKRAARPPSPCSS